MPLSERLRRSVKGGPRQPVTPWPTLVDRADSQHVVQAVRIDEGGLG